MPLESDLSIRADKFHPHAISDQTQQANEGLMKVFDTGPKWYEVSDLTSVILNAQFRNPKSSLTEYC